MVQRATLLDVAYCGTPGRYVVFGLDGKLRHVDLLDPYHERCDCGDYIWRSRICKHVAAVLIAIGDFRMWCRLQDMLAELTNLEASEHGDQE